MSAQTVLTAVIDAAAVMVGVVMDKTLWSGSTTKCDAVMELSMDGGQSWTFIGGFQSEPGGTGQVFELRRIPPEQGMARQGRYTFTPTAALVTTITQRTLDGNEPKAITP
jgi:hypothetical protein